MSSQVLISLLVRMWMIKLNRLFYFSALQLIVVCQARGVMSIIHVNLDKMIGFVSFTLFVVNRYVPVVMMKKSTVF